MKNAPIAVSEQKIFPYFIQMFLNDDFPYFESSVFVYKQPKKLK